MIPSFDALLSKPITGANLKSNKLITCSGESGRLRIDLPDLNDFDKFTDAPEMPKWLDRLPLSYLGLWGCDINMEMMELLVTG